MSTVMIFQKGSLIVAQIVRQHLNKVNYEWEMGKEKEN